MVSNNLPIGINNIAQEYGFAPTVLGAVPLNARTEGCAVT